MQNHEIYKIYVKWSATPKKDRIPPTLQEFCERYEITPGTILEFQDSDTYTKDLSSATLKWAQRKKPELLHMLYSKYMQEKTQADLRLWLEILESEYLRLL